MGKYRGLTKRRKQRAGGILDWKSVIPSGFPSSTADLKNLITGTVTGMPAIKTVSGAVGTISQVATSISGVSDTLTNLPNVVTESVQGTVEATLAKAGIPAIGSSGANNGASVSNEEETNEGENEEETNEGENEEETNEEETNEGENEEEQGGGGNNNNNNNNSNKSNNSNNNKSNKSNNNNSNNNNSNNSNNSNNNNEQGGGGNNYNNNNSNNSNNHNNSNNSNNSNNHNNSNNSNNNNSNNSNNNNKTIDIEQFGGNKYDRNKYELVTLSRPISDPLFVYYKSGKPVYFTEGSNGVRILKSGHITMSVKNKKKTTRRRHKR